MIFLPYPGRLVGIDYGTKRLGIAVSDDAQTTALPKTILSTGDFSALESLLKEVHAVGIVIGFPRTFDGSVQKIGEATQNFIAECTERFGLPLVTIDERLTSQQAHTALPQKAVIDDLAAAIILQTYLDTVQKNRSGEGLV